MIFERTARFERSFRKLTAADRQRVKIALLPYEQDPAHPSLRIKRMQGTDRIWEARASDAIRFTFEKIQGGIVLRNVGLHDPTLRRP